MKPSFRFILFFFSSLFFLSNSLYLVCPLHFFVFAVSVHSRMQTWEAWLNCINTFEAKYSKYVTIKAAEKWCTTVSAAIQLFCSTQRFYLIFIIHHIIFSVSPPLFLHSLNVTIDAYGICVDFNFCDAQFQQRENSATQQHENGICKSGS